MKEKFEIKFEGIKADNRGLTVENIVVGWDREVENEEQYFTAQKENFANMAEGLSELIRMAQELVGLEKNKQLRKTMETIRDFAIQTEAKKASEDLDDDDHTK